MLDHWFELIQTVVIVLKVNSFECVNTILNGPSSRVFEVLHAHTSPNVGNFGAAVTKGALLKNIMLIGGRFAVFRGPRPILYYRRDSKFFLPVNVRGPTQLHQLMMIIIIRSECKSKERAPRGGLHPDQWKRSGYYFLDSVNNDRRAGPA